jgi:hypothetical protein
MAEQHLCITASNAQSSFIQIFADRHRLIPLQQQPVCG